MSKLITSKDIPDKKKAQSTDSNAVVQGVLSHSAVSCHANWHFLQALKYNKCTQTLETSVKAKVLPTLTKHSQSILTSLPHAFSNARDMRLNQTV